METHTDNHLLGTHLSTRIQMNLKAVSTGFAGSVLRPNNDMDLCLGQRL